VCTVCACACAVCVCVCVCVRLTPVEDIVCMIDVPVKVRRSVHTVGIQPAREIGDDVCQPARVITEQS